jgi:hypothetical protein
MIRLASRSHRRWAAAVSGIGLLLLGIALACRPRSELITLPSGRRIQLTEIYRESRRSEPVLVISYFPRVQDERERHHEADDIVSAFSSGALQDRYERIIVRQVYRPFGRWICVDKGYQLEYALSGGAFVR